MIATPNDLARRRLTAQHLSSPRRDGPHGVVAWFGAMQAQDYGLARWSVAQRLAGGTAAAVEAAMAEGSILRAHVLRPTWHFVPRDDLRWMQATTASRVRALLAYNDRRNGVDDRTVARSTKAIARALERRGHLTRAEIARAIEAAGIAADAWMVSQLVIHAELQGVVCSGAPRGRQQTYALVDERAPRSRQLSGDEALAELARRYFRSHGPATVKDFRWWSGLDAPRAARAVAALGSRFETVAAGDRAYLFDPAAAPPARRVVSLFQSFDEIVVAYSESRDIVDASGDARARKWSLLVPGVMIDGQLAGRWAAKAEGRQRRVVVEPLRRWTAAERAAVDRAVGRFRETTWPVEDCTDRGPYRSRSTRRPCRSS